MMTTDNANIYCCGSCGYEYDIKNSCPICGSSNMESMKFIGRKNYEEYWTNHENHWRSWSIDKNKCINEKGDALTAKHYQTADIQPIEIMQMYFTKEEMIGFLRGNILKYNLRYRNKDISAKEAAKLAQYSAWLDDIENGRKIDPRK